MVIGQQTLAMVEGQFDVFAGMVLEALNKDIHAFWGPIPQYKKVIGGIDLGLRHRDHHAPVHARIAERAAQMAQLEKVRSGDIKLDGLLAYLPAQVSTGLKGQAELAVAAFASGLAVSANLNLGGFDTHGTHDEDQTAALTLLLEGIDHLWEQLVLRGLQDRVTVLIGSDFGRTPFYNTGDGKDH